MKSKPELVVVYETWFQRGQGVQELAEKPQLTALGGFKTEMSAQTSKEKGYKEMETRMVAMI